MRSRRLVLLLCSALLLVVWAVFRNAHRAPAEDALPFTGSHALILGVDDYGPMGLKPLHHAEADARKVADYFRSQKYDVSLLLRENATRARVMERVTALENAIGDHDRFVFFFAGHGKARRDEGIDVGYLLLPGGRDANDPAALLSTGDIASISRRLGRAVHQLFVFDSCHGGLLGQLQTRTDESPPLYSSEEFFVRDLAKRPTRQYLSAGGDDQEVLDGGPEGLSWFTYFLLQGLEPGAASKRESGLLTFSELASWVQACAANPVHTPAFGSLPGNRGGEYLLFTTARGQPPMAPLKKISFDTLKDLGFLTRADDVASVSESMQSMRTPIDQLYLAWQRNDIDLYLHQLAPDIVQTGRFKDGRSYSRGYDEIKAKRQDDFRRLAKVDVLNYEVMYQGGDRNRAVFGVRYNMDFHYRDGHTTSERNMKECYVVRREQSTQRWLIEKNDDYQRRICERPW
jgi:hypothetical protein